MSKPKMTAEELLGPPEQGDVVIDSAYHMGLLEQMGGLLRYERFGPLHDRPRVLADASTCQVYVGRRRALRVIERMQARIAEMERERDEARARVAELEREVEALREALTPSGATKAAYSGEVKNHGASWNDYVSWSAIKDLMKLIREHAAAAIRKEADGA